MRTNILAFALVGQNTYRTVATRPLRVATGEREEDANVSGYRVWTEEWAGTGRSASELSAWLSSSSLLSSSSSSSRIYIILSGLSLGIDTITPLSSFCSDIRTGHI